MSKTSILAITFSQMKLLVHIELEMFLVLSDKVCLLSFIIYVISNYCPGNLTLPYVRKINQQS